MMLNSTMKHRRLINRLLISMLTVALRFSYLLISKDSVFNAYTYNLWVTDHYTITENVDEEAWSSGNGNLAPKYLQTILRLEFDFDGYYDGSYYAIFTAWPSNSYYTIVSTVNCQITDYSTITNAYEITFHGVQHCEIVVTVTNYSTSNNGALPPVFPKLDYINSFFRNFTYICSSPTYLVERINSKLSDLKDNTDGIEGALSTIANSMVSTNTNLVTINSTLIDMYNRQNVTNDKIDTTNDKLDILHADNQRIITAIDSISIGPTQTDINNITNFNNQLDIVNDIEINLLDNLNDTVSNRTADGWLNVFKDDWEISRYKTIMSGVTMPFYTSNILKWIFIFLLIGVVLG